MRKTTLLAVVVLLSIAPIVAGIGSAGSTPVRTSTAASDSSLSASFTYSPSTPNPDDTITLDASDSSSSDGEIESYDWDTDGDGYYAEYDDAPSGETTTVTYGSGGTYTVGLRVTDSNGTTETTTKQITVENPEPTATFDYTPSTPNPDDTITLDASDSSDPDGEIESYEWDTDGDGYYAEYDDAASGETTSVTYGSGGTYTVGLRVTDNGGAVTTIQKQITVENPEPTAAFDYTPSTPNPDDTISLDASDATDPDGEIESYEWDTDGDGYYAEYDDASSGERTSVTYDSGGTYTVGLRVTDNGGAVTTVRKQITVENPKPTAAFEYSPSTPNPDDTITLDASGSSDLDGRIASYEWDTDGDDYYAEYDDAASGETTTVTYGSGGTYTVGLRVTDNGGETVTIRKEITVENPMPNASVTYSPAAPTPDDTIALDASNSSDPDGRIASYEWDTDGDGYYAEYDDASDGRTATLSVSSAGRYTVSVRVTDNGGRSETTSVTIPVSLPPEPSVETSTGSIGRNQPVTFDASRSTDPDGSITEYVWRFDDGTTERGASVERSFSELGRHEVTLTVVDDSGHRVETTEEVIVYPSPSIRIAADPAEPIAGSSVRFTARSDDDIDAYEWDVTGDGTTDDTGESTTHTFLESGDHTVTLTATSADGIENETSRVISVDPDASFELTSNLGTIEAGETSVVTFSITNNVPDRSVDARLRLDLPSTGVSIADVEGGSVESRSSTNFVTVSGGEQQSLRVRMRFNEPGNYSIGAESIYYYENASNDRQQSIEPITVTVTEPESDTEQSDSSSGMPGFGAYGAFVAICLGTAAAAHGSR